MGHEQDAAAGAAALDAIVTAVVETRRQIARLRAAETQLLADAVDLGLARMAARRAVRLSTDRDLPMREIALELGAAMRVSDRTVQVRMGDAAALVTRFPTTLTAWSEGRVDAEHVRVIVDAGSGIDDDTTRGEFELRMLDAASSETPARLRPIARAVAASLDPDAAGDYSLGQAARRVRVIDLDDGLARLIADLPAALAYAILDRLTQLGHAVRQANEDGDAALQAVEPAGGTDADDDADCVPDTGSEPCAERDDNRDNDADDADDSPARTVIVTGTASRRRGDEDDACAADLRTMDQLRADILADLLLAGAPAAHGNGDAFAAITGHVQVTVPVLTLAGTGTQPALLAGYGPVDPATARRLAASAPGWDRVLTHPHTGQVLAVDRYRPSKAITRFLAARDERCRAPGCNRPAIRCDRDHTIDAALGGPTSECNLCHFCRRHHTIKGVTAWTVRQVGAGLIEWTSPTGRRYVDKPPCIVRFVPGDWADETSDTAELPF